MRLGATSMPINPQATDSELADLVEDAEPAVIIIDNYTDHRANSLREGHLIEANRVLSTMEPGPQQMPPGPEAAVTAIMIFTSGTTGHPKGAELTHGNITAQLNALQNAWSWTNNDHLLHALPLFHVHGLIVAFPAALHAGATTTFLSRFKPAEVIHNLNQHHCTIFMSVPSMYRRLVRHGIGRSTDLEKVRLFTCGSDHLPDDLFHAFPEMFGQTILERYGMTESIPLRLNGCF
jgi:malonyl-CoA/methylmalonyl-CoA synthetase